MKIKKIALVGATFMGIGVCAAAAGYVQGGTPGLYIDRTGIHGVTRKSPWKLEKKKIKKLTSIDVSLDYAEIRLIPADDYYLEYRLEGNGAKPSVQIENGRLSIEEKEGGAFSGFHFGFDFSQIGEDMEEKYYVNIYYPEEEEFEEIRLKTIDGDMKLGNIQTKKLLAESGYGDVQAQRILAEKLELELGDGELSLAEAKADQMYLINSYGDVEIRKLYAKEAECQMTDGDLQIDTADTEELFVESAYGDVELGVLDWEDASFDLYTEYGEIGLPSRNGYEEAEGADYHQNGDSGSNIKVESTDGDIQIREV